MSRAARLSQDGFKNVREVAEYLGISKTAVYNLVKSNTISHAKFHGTTVIPTSTLREYAATRIKIGQVA